MFSELASQDLPTPVQYYYSTRLCPAKSRKYLTTATYPNERVRMATLHLPVWVVAPKWSHSTQRLALRIALTGLSVKHFANGRVTIPHPIFSAECAESRFIHFVWGPDFGNWVGDLNKFTRGHITAFFRLSHTKHVVSDLRTDFTKDFTPIFWASQCMGRQKKKLFGVWHLFRPAYELQLTLFISQRTLKIITIPMYRHEYIQKHPCTYKLIWCSEIKNEAFGSRREKWSRVRKWSQWVWTRCCTFLGIWNPVVLTREPDKVFHFRLRIGHTVPARRHVVRMMPSLDMRYRLAL